MDWSKEKHDQEVCYWGAVLGERLRLLESAQRLYDEAERKLDSLRTDELLAMRKKVQALESQATQQEGRE